MVLKSQQSIAEYTDFKEQLPELRSLAPVQFVLWRPVKHKLGKRLPFLPRNLVSDPGLAQYKILRFSLKLDPYLVLE